MKIKKRKKKCIFCGRKIKNQENFFPQCKEFKKAEIKLFNYLGLSLPEDLKP